MTQPIKAWDTYCFGSYTRSYSQILGPIVSCALQNSGSISACSMTFVRKLVQFKRSNFLSGYSALYFGTNSVLPPLPTLLVSPKDRNSSIFYLFWVPDTMQNPET